MIVNPPPWPNGARCAVAFTLDVDAETVVRVRHGGRAIDEPHALAHMRIHSHYLLLKKLRPL